LDRDLLDAADLEPVEHYGYAQRLLILGRACGAKVLRMETTRRGRRGRSLGSARAVAALRRSHGVHSGAILAVATLVLNGAGYLYSVICIRFLGPEGYGDVAALIALAALVALPLASVQYLFAREAAQLMARGADAEIRRLIRRSLRLAVPAAALVLLVGLAFMGPLARLLNIESRIAVAAGLSGLVVAVVVTVLYGFLQGAQRFQPLALSYAVSGIARPVFVVPILLAGLGAAGALAVNTLAGLLAFGLVAYAMRDLLFGEAAPSSPALDRGEVSIMLGASFAFASLTNADVLLASYYLDDDTAGVYAAAALVGKFVLFLPSAVVTVLLPKAAFRFASGEPSQRILLASAGVTAGLTLSVSAALAFTPENVLVRAFGPGFAESAPLLGWFGLAMTAAALVNVYLSVYLAQRQAGFPLLVVGAAVAQIVGVGAFHSDPRSIVLVTLVCFGALVLLHEAAFPYALVRIWRARRKRLAAVPLEGTGAPPPLTPP
jgi:O-antigen/teichoic acid export membrane protein